MSRLRFCLLLSVICSCSHLGNAEFDMTSPKTIIIPVHPNTTTTSTTTTTTTTPSTTTSSTTPSTTTTSTTTTPPPPPPPPTPAPTPAPGPFPPPDQGVWSYSDKKTNVTCVIVQFAAQLNVTYTKVDEKNATSLGHVLINVPANATVVGGNCTGDQWIKVNWTNPQALVANSLTIIFHKNDTTKNYGVKSLNVSLTADNFINGSSKDPIELYHGVEWQTPLATSYRCKVPTQLNMTSESTNVVARLTVSSLQEEAYRTVPGNGFSAARECGGGDIPDAVPIAVGCALGGLVVVVLVAYLVGRRRSAARGYLSM